MVEKPCQLLKHIFCYDATKLKKMAKFYVPTWTLFAGPVTIIISYIYTTSSSSTPSAVLHTDLNYLKCCILGRKADACLQFYANYTAYTNCWKDS